MIAKTISRAYPITVLVKVLTDPMVKEATLRMINDPLIDSSRAERVKNKLYTISYLKSHYEDEIRGDKPLSVMATKHKGLVIDYFKEVVKLQDNATFEFHKQYHKLIDMICSKAEQAELDKENSTGEIAAPKQ